MKIINQSSNLIKNFPEALNMSNDDFVRYIDINLPLEPVIIEENIF
jgi:hypothetical protein